MAKKRKGTNTGIPGLSFSAKRAFGVTKAKRKIAKATGIPTTKSGRQRKLGRMITGGCCLIPVLITVIAFISACMLIVLLFV